MDFHFDYEINVLKQYEYPEINNHATDHADILEKMKKLFQYFCNGQIQPMIFFTFIIDDVIMGHLVKEDYKYFYLFDQNIFYQDTGDGLA